MNPEQDLISAVLQGGSTAELLGQDLSGEMFEHFAVEWDWITQFATKNRKIPGLRTFQKTFPSFMCTEVEEGTDYYASEVRRDYAARQLGSSLDETVQLMKQGKINEALLAMQHTIEETSKTMGSVPDGDVLRDNADVMSDIQDFHDRIVDTGFAGIPTGFKTWDEMTGGCKPGEFIVVGGRLGGGKSWVLAKMATSALMEGYTVLYDSLEMTRTNITLRVQTLLSQAVGRPYAAADLMTGTSIPDLVGYKEIVAHLDSTVPGALHVADTTKGRVSPLTIAAQIERIQPDIVFIDYLTLLDMTGDGDWKSVTSLSNTMKQMAQRYKIPIVAAAQLNRANGLTRGVPNNEAIARSDSIGQDADQIMNLQRKSTRVVAQKLTKNRNGLDGISWFSEFRPGAGVVEEINQERAYELMDEDGVDE